MTTVYLRSATNEIYSSQAFNYISRQEGFIDIAASIVGISAGAIAGAMAEENAAYDWKDQVLDHYVVFKIGAQISLSEISLFKLAIDQGLEQANEWLMTYIEDVVTENSHENWKADYEAVESDNNPSTLDKYLQPTLSDCLRN